MDKYLQYGCDPDRFNKLQIHLKSFLSARHLDQIIFDLHRLLSSEAIR